MCGPMVISGELGRSGGLSKEDFWQVSTTVGRKAMAESEAPVFTADSVAEVVKHIQPVREQPLRFETGPLGDAGKDDFLHVEIPLPAAVIQDRSSVTIRFQAHPGNMAGGLFDLRLLKPE